MKKTALFAAVAALMAATPAAAGGYVGLSYGSTDADSASSDIDTWQVEGAVGHNSGGWGFQVDGSIGNSESDTGDADHTQFAGHLYWGGSGWRFGGVIVAANVDDSGAEVEEFAYGIEATHDFGPNSVLVASATFGEVEYFGSDIDTWNIDAGLNFYTASNFKFNVNLGFGNLDAGGAEADTISGGIGAEWAPFAAPVSFTIGWNHFDDDDTIIGASDTISIGARWNFGGGSLRDRDNATPFDTRTGFYPRVLDLR